MENFKDRLLFLWGAHATPSKIAAEIGMTLAGFSRIWKEDGLPKAETLLKIKELKQCSLDWLLTGEGEVFAAEQEHPVQTVSDTLDNQYDIEDFVFIPQYDIQAAAGHGRLVGDETPVHAVPFQRHAIERLIGGDASQLAVIAVKGDSMEGVLNDGDLILVNLRETMPRDGLYVLRINENLLVKRLQLVPGGVVNVISANESYPAFQIHLNQTEDDFAVIGKVEWFGRQI
ncbi:MAG: helix-turn-helix transcriptional regulator [Eikenella sp.]|nr:helix-turn-helix transcriptional regulator [Eikenella sp.]